MLALPFNLITNGVSCLDARSVARFAEQTVDRLVIYCQDLVAYLDTGCICWTSGIDLINLPQRSFLINPHPLVRSKNIEE